MCFLIYDLPKVHLNKILTVMFKGIAKGTGRGSYPNRDCKLTLIGNLPNI